MRHLYSLWFKLNSWTFEGQSPKDLPKFIIAVAPHTANADFFIGVMARSYLQLKKTKYLGKSQLFKPPFGFIFRWLGGYPVDRSKNNNLVDAVVELFNSKASFSIALAPEGTRKKVDKIKTGFYHIAKKANVPIVLIGFDLANKKIRICEAFMPGEDVLADFKMIIDFFSSCKGIHPEKGIDPDMYQRMLPDLKAIQQAYSH
jgi:1-acyl-sn-glycerol-3-phosphate acyltransferase